MTASPEPAVGLVLDPCFEGHDTGAGHPERPRRLGRLREALEASQLASRCRRIPLASAGDDLLLAVHSEEHVRRVERACREGGALDADTRVCPRSEELARLAAGSVTALCRAVLEGELRRGFASVRPPGHHAERDRAMGFCLYNNVAVAARALIDRTSVQRVFILDWDVHHGNGTQQIFEEDPAVFYASVHQWPLYPGTGAASEVGRGDGRGTTLNCTLAPGDGDEAFLAAIDDRVLPAARAFAPDFVLLSAGFDAHRDDPLANLEVTVEGFAAATRRLLAVAEQACDGRFVSVLEGGYDLEALANSACAHLEVLLEPS